MVRTLGLALTFLTIFPYPRHLESNPAELARSMVWFPLVGLLLGLFLGAVYLGLALIFPNPAVAAFLVAVLVVATRGLHLDGLADTLDGLGGGQTPEARLRIMKDSALGAFGVLGLIVILLLKFALILALIEQADVRALVLFPVLSRWSMVALAYLSPYARPEGGLGQAMTSLVSGRYLWVASLSALFLALLTYGRRGLGAWGLIALSTWLASHYFQRRLGGITGDVLGAVNEFNEVLALAVALA
ncbi:MAG: adenosylcobinamide-GDP ribazoletransferase [Deltaproteobacteria bacterium]|nr:adenosylcobinamide-GDP ribazoletransferase [Deltaproteobacteria bacterium]MBW1986733.1 adenosylcobinamide-GDP ribazoletransferase [Deltaproteobacteria bacterium]MBW2134260.1 adenosylcobinamide-GDP ribazoletransferase [Deltaproteobacteria bacterium]